MLWYNEADLYLWQEEDVDILINILALRQSRDQHPCSLSVTLRVHFECDETAPTTIARSCRSLRPRFHCQNIHF